MRKGCPIAFTLQSQETAYWTLYIYPPGHEVRPKVKEIMRGWRPSTKRSKSFPRKKRSATPRRRASTWRFSYLDLLVEAKIRTLRTPSATLIWHYQAESREFEEREPVFKAIAVQHAADSWCRSDRIGSTCLPNPLQAASACLRPPLPLAASFDVVFIRDDDFERRLARDAALLHEAALAGLEELVERGRRARVEVGLEDLPALRSSGVPRGRSRGRPP